MKKDLTYLVVVDMQNDFLTGPLGNDHCRRTIDPVCMLIDRHKREGNRIFITQDTHGEDYFDTLEGKKLPVKHCIPGQDGWKVNDKVWMAVNASKFGVAAKWPTVVQKPTFGSFNLLDEVTRAIKYDLDQARELDEVGAPHFHNIPSHDLGTLTFDLCGVCTSICVLANAVLLRAKFPNAIIRIHKDACGDVTEEAHEAALKVLQMQQCDIV